MTIRTIKTWHGVKFAIVDESGHVVDLNNTCVAVYPNTKEGLAQAREVLASLKK